ncbi:hypothetical protein [Caballeronia sp. LZ034LL]|uniref:hypothetical protein n=1 Tax=Caballeronia sp. LZ034LL TaxID=3038567 RepID=UPI002867AD14|nr:hypothetical protein [Caballeronia sp. LZ034LL]MDR5834812.1 hypothetical protein [Caballeronia sp. LZ034LL]
MNFQLLLVALVAVIVTGCTTWSSPMSNANLLTFGSGDHAWQVQCDGLFASDETCMKHARSICEQESVTVLDAVDAMSSDDPRELTFVCGDVAASASRDASAGLGGCPARAGREAAFDARNAGHAGSIGRAADSDGPDGA